MQLVIVDKLLIREIPGIAGINADDCEPRQTESEKVAYVHKQHNDLQQGCQVVQFRIKAKVFVLKVGSQVANLCHKAD